jgi:SAM-dependent methyltransferase
MAASDGDPGLGSGSTEQIYERRFPDAEARRRYRMWGEIVAYLQRYFPRQGSVIDIGAGNGEFISQIDVAERWATDIRDTSSALPADVEFVNRDGLSLADAVPNDHFDRAFMSNYLEHMDSGAAVIEQLSVARQLLKPGGRVVIMQPNIALVGPRYWDFIDHKVALTEHSLAEAVELAGMRSVVTIPRFLPYSTKGRLPTAPGLVRAYLAFPPAWRLLGKQTLMIAERPAD